MQEQAIPLILDGSADLLMTAPTAGGKTEAAFLPLVSWLEEGGAAESYGVLCLSPLKALINDQFDRLELLCEAASTHITPWHGDVSQSVKRSSWKEPCGILMITPESLEAMFVRRAGELQARMAELQYVVIDEFHAFIGTERGQQLVSLLGRLEALLKRPLKRIALSATIGDPDMALDFLRPDKSREGIHLDVSGESLDLKLLVKAYQMEDELLPASRQMAEDLFDWLRGDSHLVFGNSRRIVEEMTDLLTSLSEEGGVPLEFFAHHGSLSKDARRFVENRLRTGHKPTTAIATSTLELGIDIGDVVSVGQVGPPANVSSLRQRLGRSGRRSGQSAILRVLIESTSNHPKPDPAALLEIELFQTIAVIDKLLQRWIEPPDISKPHFSTLIQQLLSMIAFTGGVTALEAYQTLCIHGPWTHINADLFGRFLRSIASKDVITQLPSGELIVGLVGERTVSKFDFYTAFTVPEEFRLVANGRPIGTIPIDNPVMPGQLMLFAGRRWQVESIELESNVINLRPGGPGQPPRFGGERASAHVDIHRNMKTWYEKGDTPGFCDAETQALIGPARTYYAENRLGEEPFVRDGKSLYWLIWESERVVNTIIIAACSIGLRAASEFGPLISIEDSREGRDIAFAIYDFLASHSLQEISSKVAAAPIDKHDELLDESLMRESYVAATLDIAGASGYLEMLLSSVGSL